MPAPAANRPIVIIDNYDSFTFNLYQMVQALTDCPVVVYRNDAITFEALRAQKPNRVILSPGPGHPAVEKDFGVCREIVENFAELDCPVLGVCLGYQGIAHYLGGTVEAAPEIIHGKSSPVSITQENPLLSGLPNPFEAMRYHSLLVTELPPSLEFIAQTESGLPMALRHKQAPVYGVQFHPESIGTPAGEQLLRNFLEKC